MGSETRKSKVSLAMFVLLIICYTNTCSGAALLGHEKGNATNPCHGPRVGERCLSIGEDLEDLDDLVDFADWEYWFMDSSQYSNTRLLPNGAPQPDHTGRTGDSNHQAIPCGTGTCYGSCIFNRPANTYQCRSG